MLLFVFQAWGAENTFTSDELLLLNNFAKGFTAAELNSMDFSSNDVITSFGSVSGFTSDQAEKIFAKIKTYTGVSSMTGSDLLRLGSLAVGMTTSDIAAINSDAFKYVPCFVHFFANHCLPQFHVIVLMCTQVNLGSIYCPMDLQLFDQSGLIHL